MEILAAAMRNQLVACVKTEAVDKLAKFKQWQMQGFILELYKTSMLPLISFSSSHHSQT
jgi:hypothetical protein